MGSSCEAKRNRALVIGVVLLACVLAPAMAWADYYCSVCGRAFSNPARAREHIEKKHGGRGQVRDYSTDGTCIYTGGRCPGCGSEFKSPAQYRKHLKRCQKFPKQGKPQAGDGKRKQVNYHCQFCGKEFASHADAARHSAQCPSRPTSGAKAPAEGPRQVGAKIDRPVAGPEDDVIVLKNGQKFVGDVQSISPSSVTLKTPQGAVMTIKMDDVEQVLGVKAEAMAAQAGKP